MHFSERKEQHFARSLLSVFFASFCSKCIGTEEREGITKKIKFLDYLVLAKNHPAYAGRSPTTSATSSWDYLLGQRSFCDEECTQVFIELPGTLLKDFRLTDPAAWFDLHLELGVATGRLGIVAAELLADV